MAALVGAEAKNVRFTSGASESIRLALRIAVERNGGQKLRIAATRIEHDAVLENLTALVDQGEAEVRWIGVDECARIDLADMDDALVGGVDLAVMMAANNEVGTVYPIEAIVRSAHAAGAEILVDATQAAGRERIAATEWGIDYLVFNAHKIYGPKGVGALITDHAHWTFARRNGPERTIQTGIGPVPVQRAKVRDRGGNAGDGSGEGADRITFTSAILPKCKRPVTEGLRSASVG